MKTYAVILSIFMFLGCNHHESVDIIFHNGQIISMASEGEQFEALAVKDGKIHALGSSAELRHLLISDAEVIDLGGHTLLPGFIDAHSHISMGMEVAAWANLSSPPVSDVGSVSDIVKKLQSHYSGKELGANDWIVGWGYDPDLLVDQRHPNKFDLDDAFPDKPVFLIHVSGHLGVVNSVGLDRLGWSSETVNPMGGQIMRIRGSAEPDGLVAESAMHMVRHQLPQPDSADLIELAHKAFNLYVSNGITTANDGFSAKEHIHNLEWLKGQMTFPIDVISLVGFTDFADVMKESPIQFGEYDERLKYAGVKIVADGSPQGKTAFMTDPYLTEVPGCAHDCRGISVVNQKQLDGLLSQLYGQGIQVYTHCN